MEDEASTALKSPPLGDSRPLLIFGAFFVLRPGRRLRSDPDPGFQREKMSRCERLFLVGGLIFFHEMARFPGQYIDNRPT
jgi:hypothetical protein